MIELMIKELLLRIKLNLLLAKPCQFSKIDSKWF